MLPHFAVLGCSAVLCCAVLHRIWSGTAPPLRSRSAHWASSSKRARSGRPAVAGGRAVAAQPLCLPHHDPVPLPCLPAVRVGGGQGGAGCSRSAVTAHACIPLMSGGLAYLCHVLAWLLGVFRVFTVFRVFRGF